MFGFLKNTSDIWIFVWCSNLCLEGHDNPIIQVYKHNLLVFHFVWLIVMISFGSVLSVYMGKIYIGCLATGWSFAAWLLCQDSTIKEFELKLNLLFYLNPVRTPIYIYFFYFSRRDWWGCWHDRCFSQEGQTLLSSDLLFNAIKSHGLDLSCSTTDLNIGSRIIS